jgi:ABC-type bacteriocin/lantibiotic exporter with double-glycine peptidase domain
MTNKFFIKKYLNKYKYTITYILILNLLVLISLIITTYITGNYIDLLIEHINMSLIFKFTSVLIFLGFFEILFGYINSIKHAKLQANMVFDINFEVIKHVKKLPISFFKDKDSVYLNQRINEDSNEIVNFMLSFIINLVTYVTSFIVVFYILVKKNVFLSIFVLFSIPLYLLLYYLFEKKLYKSTMDYKEKQNRFISYLNRQLSNISYIKLNSLFKTLDNELVSEYPKFLNSLIKYYKCSYNFSSLGSMLNKLFNVFLFLYGGISIYNNKMTIGDFIVIKSYYVMLLESVYNLTNILKTYPNAKVSYDRLNSILETKNEINGKFNLESIDSIEINNLNFKYDEKNIINNFNYKFDKGNVYLIKGSNGSGKSTLLKVILGLHIDDFEGEIVYNGINIKDIDLYEIRKNIISIVDQEPLLLYSDIYRNITQNVKDIDVDFNLIKELIKEFNLKNIGSDFKNNNITFSGGEKQKISIIRSLIKDYNVIIMDEPTSALDTNSTEYFLKKINTIKNDKIIIIISHDREIEQISDKIIYMNQNENLNLSKV